MTAFSLIMAAAGAAAVTPTQAVSLVHPLGIYVLQDVVPADIGAAPVDVKVVESTSDGANTMFTPSDVATMRGSRGIVLGYFSLGEAENYRAYYAGAVAAGIVGPVDPSWPGNFEVAFWTSQWQTICFSWCDRMIAAGFDGMYMDVVDEWGLSWAQSHVPGGGATNSANAMITLIGQIRTHAQASNPNFQIWVNGGEELFGFSPPSYFNTFDGMYKEQVCYSNNGTFRAESSANRQAEYDLLSNATLNNKPVVLIEYVTGATAVANVKAQVATWGNYWGYYIATPDLQLDGVDHEGWTGTP